MAIRRIFDIDSDRHRVRVRPTEASGYKAGGMIIETFRWSEEAGWTMDSAVWIASELVAELAETIDEVATGEDL